VCGLHCIGVHDWENNIFFRLPRKWCDRWSPTTKRTGNSFCCIRLSVRLPVIHNHTTMKTYGIVSKWLSTHRSFLRPSKLQRCFTDLFAPSDPGVIPLSPRHVIKVVRLLLGLWWTQVRRTTPIRGGDSAVRRRQIADLHSGWNRWIINNPATALVSWRFLHFSHVRIVLRSVYMGWIWMGILVQSLVLYQPQAMFHLWTNVGLYWLLIHSFIKTIDWLYYNQNQQCFTGDKSNTTLIGPITIHCSAFSSSGLQSFWFSSGYINSILRRVHRSSTGHKISGDYVLT